MKYLISTVLGPLLLGSIGFSATPLSHPDLKNKELVLLRGVPGQEQATDYCVIPYKKSQAGLPVVFSGLATHCARLGIGLKVSAGPVAILYSGSLLFTEKKVDQALNLELRTIEIFPKNSAASFRVWTDLTKKSEQEKLMLKNWISKKEMHEACMKSPLYMDQKAFHKACDPYLATADFRQGMSQVFEFSKNGAMTVTYKLPFAAADTYYYPRGVSIGESLAPGSVALLPGAYVIEWQGLRAGDPAVDERIVLTP